MNFKSSCIDVSERVYGRAIAPQGLPPLKFFALSSQHLRFTMCAQFNVTTAAYGKPPVFEYTLLLIALACIAQVVGA